MMRSMLALSEVERGVRAINESHLAWYSPAQRKGRNRRDSFVLSRYFRQAWAERRPKAAVEARQVLERVKSYWGETSIGKLAADWLGSTVMGDDPAIPFPSAITLLFFLKVGNKWAERVGLL